mmetsp:Transcript_29886/g.72433  ORF Transcript_29886/g.72433 Transcript_29886/m.72433 type:complete len:142 (+) Transcript_29886:241-666(+)|eukprot:CAMPEP_0113468776 /NCGR_PEP_ID=MMETSP0014_2-20120614/15538_1 /TAXON_ID=2857 /ORGANISM="Nitzschia sp." /LENGTH=141 /DNA_ID=CAMNT_0000361193 /DNA_START=116 /DNA_END=541 /DNA_ORIENTATION=+ /assembly_acc=CAM_ASM_000159
MAVGPFARILAQIVVPVVAVLARALPAAYSQALQNARKAGVDATEAAAAPVFGKRISRSEALQVLNLTEAEAAANPEAIQKQFERYFAANDVKKGGSFYLQSKIYRAHEQLMEFQKEKRQEEHQQQQQHQQEGGGSGSGDK